MNRHSYLIPHSVSSTIRRMEEGREERDLWRRTITRACKKTLAIKLPSRHALPSAYRPLWRDALHNTLSVHISIYTFNTTLLGTDWCKVLRSPGYFSLFSHY